MKTSRLEGIIPILLMPFDEKGRIDTDSLQSLVDYNLAAGIHGLGIAIGSEIFKLTPDECVQVLKIVAERVAGRVPVIMNASAAATQVGIDLAQQAADNGADQLMLYPPSFMPMGADALTRHFGAVSHAVDLPIILQDLPQSPISPALALRIAQEVPNVKCIKVETMPTVTQVAAMTATTRDQLTTFGGAGGSYFIEEFQRGAHGTMPFASQPVEFMNVWNHLKSGDMASARQTFERAIMAVNRIADQQGDIFYHVHKALLVRRGIIKTAFVREPTEQPDILTRCEIEAFCAEMN